MHPQTTNSILAPTPRIEDHSIKPPSPQPNTLTTLPPELLHLILIHLPSTSTANLRLTSTYFSRSPIIYTYIFSPLLKTWLSPTQSHQMISSIASNLTDRPAVMWSPWVLEEKMKNDVETAMLLGDRDPRNLERIISERVFLEIVWRLVVGSEYWDGDDDGKEKSPLSMSNFAERSGKEDYPEWKLKMGKSRFLLYQKMTRDEEDKW